MLQPVFEQFHTQEETSYNDYWLIVINNLLV